jgi:GT2 family glycosyltransferase
MTSDGETASSPIGPASHQVGVVAIGRNEGERLKACLRSVVGQAALVVYVDSGSSDGSVEFARSLGVEAVLLDMAQPFTAARARNAGIDRLCELRPKIPFVQVVDGDCEVAGGWLDLAATTLEGNSQLAVACGRRRERWPDATIYNRLCDMEWAAVPGITRECGGDAIIRLQAFRQVGGYNPALIAGEEPEMCVRLRQAGWQILRLDAEMTLHDAAMTRFGQWWRRAVRCGHAYAEGAALHGAAPERHKVRQLRSTVLWGAIVPLAIAVAALAGAWWRPAWLLAAAMALGYLVVAARVFRYRTHTRGDPARHALLYAAFTVLAKFPEAAGAARYVINRLRGRRTRLIEYKRRPERQPA